MVTQQLEIPARPANTSAEGIREWRTTLANVRAVLQQEQTDAILNGETFADEAQLAKLDTQIAAAEAAERTAKEREEAAAAEAERRRIEQRRAELVSQLRSLAGGRALDLMAIAHALEALLVTLEQEPVTVAAINSTVVELLSLVRNEPGMWTAPDGVGSRALRGLAVGEILGSRTLGLFLQAAAGDGGVPRTLSADQRHGRISRFVIDAVQSTIQGRRPALQAEAWAAEEQRASGVDVLEDTPAPAEAAE